MNALSRVLLTLVVTVPLTVSGQPRSADDATGSRPQSAYQPPPEWVDHTGGPARSVTLDNIQPSAGALFVRYETPVEPAAGGDLLAPTLFVQTSLADSVSGSEAVVGRPPGPVSRADEGSFESGAFAPPVLTGFQGIADTGSIPPDTMGAVGPDHVVNIVNGGFEVFDRSGTSLSWRSLRSFWGALGTAAGEPASTPFDPKMLYDQYSDRWIAVSDGNPDERDGTNNSWLLVGISQTTDPTQVWNLYAIRANIDGYHPNDWVDYPGIGIDPENLIVTNNVFTVGDRFGVHADVWVIEKAKLIAAAGPLVENVDYRLIHDPCGRSGFTYAPCHTFGQSSATAENYILDEGWLDVTTRTRRMLRVKRITGTGAAATIVGCAMARDWIEVAGYNFNKLGAEQDACPATIATNDTRLLDAVWRNGKIWVTQSIGEGSGINDSAPPTKSEVAWYEIDPDDAGSFPGGTPLQQGRVSHPTLAYSFPSIAVNANECVALGFAGSDEDTFAGGYYTLRAAVDIPGTMQSVALLKAGEGHYWKTFGGSSNRWGDFSATVVDPLDDETFWTTQEYAMVPSGSQSSCTIAGNGSGQWATWWGKFECAIGPPGSPQPDPDDVEFNRYISMQIPSSGGAETAIRVRLTSLHHPATPPDIPDFSSFEGQDRYVNLIRDDENQPIFDCPDSEVPATSFKCAKLGCAAEYRDWGTELAGEVLYVTGPEVVPSSQYDVVQLGPTCQGNEVACAEVSDELATFTGLWGNLDDDPLHSVLDIATVVDKVKALATAFVKVRTQLQPDEPDSLANVNVLDVANAVDALKLAPYPFDGPTACD